jgi:chitin synthase
VRYSALTCRPSGFSDSKFISRPSLFAKPRSTKLFVAISVSENDLNLPSKYAAFARTLRSAMQSINDEAWRNHAAVKDIWKSIVIGIITDGMVKISNLPVLEEMNLYYNDCRRASVNHKDVWDHL